MKIWSAVLLCAVGAFTSGCMTRTPRVLPADHGLTTESALTNVQSVVDRRASNGITPQATRTQFQYWDWKSSELVSSYGNYQTYRVPLKSVPYTDITNITVDNFIWICPLISNPYLDTSVSLLMADGNSLTVKPPPNGGDVLNMLPPFWFFDPKRRVRKANALADSFLLLRSLQTKNTNEVETPGGRAAFEDAIRKSVSTGGLSSDEITLTYPDGSKKTISTPEK